MIRALGIVAWSVAMVAPASTEIPETDRRSGHDFMSAPTRAMQDDDTANPGMLGVLDGEALWSRKAGEAQKACADCHSKDAMKGVAARYPAVDPARQQALNLEQRINVCRSDNQRADPFAYESRDLLALTAYVGLQSRGQPIAIAPDPATQSVVARGRDAFMQRRGQLNLSCAQCHDDNWQGRLAGSPITQGQPTGYPIYRLEWQSLGSLQRRLRNCFSGMRAVSPALGSRELVELELYLMWRARGMPLETPAVRP